MSKKDLSKTNKNIIKKVETMKKIRKQYDGRWRIYSVAILVLIFLVTLTPFLFGSSSLTQTSQADFSGGTTSQTAVTNVAGGEVQLSNSSSGADQLVFGTTSAGEVSVDASDAYPSFTPVMARDSLDNVYVAYFQSNTTWDILIKKYDTDGALDTDFGTAGTLNVYSVSTSGGIMPNIVQLVYDTVNDLFYVVFDSGSAASADKTVYLKKFSTAGVLDTSFGTAGTVTVGTDTVNTNSATRSFSADIDSTGKIYVAINGAGGSTDLVIKRYTTAGVLDSAYASSGTLDVAEADDSYTTVGDPLLDVNGGDNLYIAYYLYLGSDTYGIYVMKYDSDGALATDFATDGILTLVTASDGAIRPNDMHFTGSGYAYIVWNDQTNFNLFASRFDTAGAIDTGFGTAGVATISNATNNQQYSRLAIDPDNNLYVTWEDNRGSDYDVYVTKIDTDGDVVSAFGASGVVTAFNDSNDQTKPTTIVDTNGRIYIATMDDRSTGTGKSNIYVRRFSSLGVRDTGYPAATVSNLAITATENGQDMADIVRDTSGNIYVVWHDERGDGATGDIYMKKYTPGGLIYDGSLASPEFGTAGEQLVSNAGTNVDQRAPAVAVDSSSNIYVAFYDARDDSAYTVYVKKFSSAGVLDTDFGTSGELVVQEDVLLGDGSPDDEVPTALSIAVDSADKVYVAYYNDPALDLADTNVYVEKFDSTGAVVTAFGTSGTLTVEGGVALGYSPYMAIDDSNNLFVVHTELPDDFSDELIKMKKYDSDGDIVTAFGSSGVVTVQDSASGYDRFPYVSVDSAGSIYVAWVWGEDIMALTYSNVNVKKFTSAGALDTAFASSGLLSISEEVVEYYPRVVTDSSNRVYLAIAGDNGDASYSRYARRYSSAGALDTGFGTAGTLTLATNTNPGDPLVMAVDSSDNAYFFWSESGEIMASKYNDGGASVYYSTGVFTSATIDTGISTAIYGNISWTSVEPSNTGIVFQVATSTTDGDYVYRGPGGFLDTYYTTSSGQDIWSGQDSKRYMRYRAFLSTSDTSTTPRLDDVTISFTGFTPDDPTSLGPSVMTNQSRHANPLTALTFILSDTDSEDTLKYRIQIDDTSSFVSPVIDYTSALAIQGARTFSVGQAVGGGTYVVGSTGQAISDGSYYWRVKTIDSASLESGWSTANSGEIAFIVQNIGAATFPRSDDGVDSEESIIDDNIDDEEEDVPTDTVDNRGDANNNDSTDSSSEGSEGTMVTPPTTPGVVVPTPKPVVDKFTRLITIGSTGEDVRELQKFLNSRGYVLIKAGPGSLGNETAYFGQLTAAALTRFQNDNASIVFSPANLADKPGQFGLRTKSLINRLVK